MNGKGDLKSGIFDCFYSLKNIFFINTGQVVHGEGRSEEFVVGDLHNYLIDFSLSFGRHGRSVECTISSFMMRSKFSGDIEELVVRDDPATFTAHYLEEFVEKFTTTLRRLRGKQEPESSVKNNFVSMPLKPAQDRAKPTML